jgi:predicted ATPase
MLAKVRIENFKCLADTEVSLGAFNVLIGPNDSGKTSFLQALGILAGRDFGDIQSLVWQKDQSRKVMFEASGPTNCPFVYRLNVYPASGDVLERLEIGNHTLLESQRASPQLKQVSIGNKPPFQIAANQRVLGMAAQRENPPGPVTDAKEHLQCSEIIELDPKAMRVAVPATPNPSLNSTGSNLAAVLQSMLSGPDRQSVLDVESNLREAIPTLKGVSLSTQPNSSHLIEFTLNSNTRPPVTIPCSQASDGSMLLLGFLVLVYGNAPQCLLIEEPENGLHPSRLQMVIDILRKISTGEIGNHPRQVILSTHSPLLLNFVQPEEVRVFRRDEKQGTKVDSMDKLPNVTRLRKEFAPGELWYLFGEEDLVKGKAS